MWDLQIDVLGPLAVRQSSGVPLAFESLKTRALLVYLAVESDRAHSRETLAGMLWPDRPDAVSLSNLRHTLASLRTTLGERIQDPVEIRAPFFNISPNSIQFNNSTAACVDLIEFEKHLAASSADRKGIWQASIAHLNAAVSLYRGPFLDGFSLKGCPEFEDWMLLRREAISLKLQKALYNLADGRVAAGDWEDALTTLRQLLQLDPWNEAVHRKVMSLLAALNQRNAALSQYERCRKLLLDELGVAPEEETVRLYEHIRAGVFTGQHMLDTSRQIRNREAGRPVEKLFLNQFAGRTLELDKLRRSLNLALDQQGQLVFITGEAGSGKTSLACEFVHQAMAQQSGLLVAAGRCNAITGFEDPFLPFREALHMLVCADEHLSGRLLTPEHRRRLNEAFPEIIKSLLSSGVDLVDSFISRETLIQRIEAFGPAGQVWLKKLKQILPPAVERPALASANAYKPQEALFRVLTELARSRPLILFIDDLQWADVGSVSLFHYLSKRLTGSRVVLLGAYRPQDIANGWGETGALKLRHPLERVRLELQREFGDIDVNLDHAEGIGFIDALIDQVPNDLDKTFRHMLYSHTRGNPLFIVELMRGMQDRGQIVRNDAGLWVQGKPLDWEMLPARVEAVIAERVGRLSPAYVKLLQVASVEGEVFTAEVVARVLNLDESQVLSDLSETLSHEQHLVSALSASCVEQVAPGQVVRLSSYRFNHFLFQKYIYNHIDPVERSALHQAVGMALVAMSGQDSVDRSLHLAWHFQQANQVFQAVEYLLLAGKQAVNLFAYADAKVIYDRCLGLLQQLPESPERSRFEVQVQLAREVPLLATNGWGTSDEGQAANRAIELSDQYHQKSSNSSVLLALYFQADYFSARNNASEALARANLLVNMANASDERIDRIMGYTMAGQVNFLVGKLTAAFEYFEKALDNYRQEDKALLVELVGVDPMNTCLVWMACTQWLRGYPEQSQTFARQAIDLARQQSNTFFTSLTIAISGVFLSALRNEPEQVVTYARECLALVAPNSPQIDRIMVEICLGWARVKLGDCDNGLEMLNEAISHWNTTDKLIFKPMGLILQADAHSLVGQTEEGLQNILAAEALIEQSGRRLLEAYAYWVHGEILAREQRRFYPRRPPDPSPVTWFERAINVARQQQSRSFELRATLSLAQLVHLDGRKGEMASWLEAIFQQFTEGFETPELRSASNLLAELRAR